MRQCSLISSLGKCTPNLAQSYDGTPVHCQAIYACLAEKERRSGSMRTVGAYSGTLRFFGTLGKLPDYSKAKVGSTWIAIVVSAGFTLALV